MNTKLTLRLDDQLITKAKRYSDRSGKSVSQLVADFFSAIDAEEDIPGTQISPRVRSLRGAFKGSTATEEDYRRYLEEKYQ
jgi:antitoxin component of RelBE/YafQ-DinJ toxin-antitoxin module